MGRLCDYQEWNTEMNACYTCNTSLLYTINKSTFACNREGFLYN
ncbi:MAG: hypothetical protein P8J34_04295 [Flavobacteriales bacterium]|nr:hypothetical protein [Flavobacteriales bacterium]